MPYKATTNWKFIQPHLPAKSRTTSRTAFRTCLATPNYCVAKVTACDMWVKKLPRPLYRKYRQPQFKNWKEINCKFLHFSILHENPDYWQAPPCPNSPRPRLLSVNFIFWKVLHAPWHAGGIDRSTRRSSMGNVRPAPSAGRTSRLTNIWKKISNEVLLIKASGGVTARWLKITKVIVFSQKYCAKGVIFSLVWKRALGKKMKRIQWTRDKLILVLDLYLSNGKTFSKIPEDMLAK